MTITVHEIPGRTATWKVEKNLHRTYQLAFQVLSTGPAEGATVNAAILSYLSAKWSATVLMGFPYPYDSVALLWGIDSKSHTEKDQLGCVWDSVVTFDTQTPDPAQNNQNPTDNPPVVSVDVKNIDFHVLKDLDDVPVLNKAGDPLDGLIVTKACPVIQFEVNTASFNESEASTYSLKTNSDSWRGYSAGELLLEYVKASVQFQNGHKYWKRQYQIIVTPEDDWKKYILNAGFFKKSGGVRHRLTDALGNAYSVPRPLNSAGDAEAAAGSEVYLPFRIYGSTAFTTLFGA